MTDLEERKQSCSAFEEGDPDEGNGKCDSDGHYLCQNCKHLKPSLTNFALAVEEHKALIQEIADLDLRRTRLVAELMRRLPGPQR